MHLSEMKNPLIVNGEKKGEFYSLPALTDAGFDNIARLPISLRIVLESVLRHCGGGAVSEAHLQALANWQPQGKRDSEVPFTVGRVVLQDFTGAALAGQFFGDAARVLLAISQGAVSQRAKQAQLGAPLFERGNRRQILPAPGR